MPGGLLVGVLSNVALIDKGHLRLIPGAASNASLFTDLKAILFIGDHHLESEKAPKPLVASA